MPAATSELYARPLIVFLIISATLLIAVNYVPVLMRDAGEGFADISITYPTLTCPADTAVYTTENVLTPASNSILPQPTEISRKADGTLTAAAMTAYIGRLRSEKRIPEDISVGGSADAAAIAAFAAADEAALKAIATEYCYIKVRYEYCVRKFVDGAFSAGSGSTVTNYESWLQAARTLVVRLVDILSLIVALKESRAAKYAGNQAAAQEAAAATQKISALLSQKKDLNDPESAKKLYMKMVEYTTEKNRANANLIALYSGLNLVALGMLFYIYRAS